MTNPNNIVRIGTRNGGFASVLEGNNSAQAFTTGLYSGNGVLQNTSPDLNVLVGGSASNPDTLIASTPSGAKVIIDIAGQQAVQITTPVSNSRIASVVAYTNDLSIESTDTTKTGNPSSCGLIVVYGSQSASPSPATDSDIRAAITTDGATGSQSAYCVVANITVANNTTAITNTLINLQRATLNTNNIRNGSIEPEKLIPNFPRTPSIAGGLNSLDNMFVSIPPGLSGILLTWIYARNTGGGDNIISLAISGTGVTTTLQARAVATGQYISAGAVGISTVSATHSSSIAIIPGQTTTSDQQRMGYVFIPDNINI